VSSPLRFVGTGAIAKSDDPAARRVAAALAAVSGEPSATFSRWSGRIEAERARLLADDREIEVLAPGPGGTDDPVVLRKVLSDVTARVSSSPKRARLLYSLIEEFRPEVALEMGSGVGISTSYQAAACAEAGGRLVCLEGAPGLAAVTAGVLERSGLRNRVDVRVGWFDDTLPPALAEGVAYAYVDGYHQREPTLRYHELLVEHTRPGAVLVYDDIRWSEGMEEAWSVIAADPRVAVSVDLRWRGLVVLP
jgi:predicted O-methyltransferase YrrM